MSKTSFPPGFRFHPTDVELVCYYLKRKVMGKPLRFEAISEIELYKFPPWDLPAQSQLRSRDLEWYFFCPRDRKYANGSRANRTTDVGYWKTTGNDRSVTHNSRDIGMKRTLIFHLGKAPKGDRTNWVMYEYRLQDEQLAETGILQDAYVLCKIFQKSGSGPKPGEQYGAPFVEEDWEDDMVMENFSFPCLSHPSPRIMVDAVCRHSSAVGEESRNPDLPLPDGISLVQPERMHNASHPFLENATTEMSEMSGSTILNGVGNITSAVNTETIHYDLRELSALAATSGNVGNSDRFSRDPMLNSMSSELDTEQFVELNDITFLEEDYASDFVLPNCSLPLYSIGCNPTSKHLGDFDDSTSLFDSLVAAFSGVGDHFCAGLDMDFERSKQDLEIEAFVGSFLNQTSPGFEAEEHETMDLVEELNDAPF